jgi:hypothetical protein
VTVDYRLTSQGTTDVSIVEIINREDSWRETTIPTLNGSETFRRNRRRRISGLDA